MAQSYNYCKFLYSTMRTLKIQTNFYRNINLTGVGFGDAIYTALVYVKMLRKRIPHNMSMITWGGALAVKGESFVSIKILKNLEYFVILYVTSSSVFFSKSTEHIKKSDGGSSLAPSSVATRKEFRIKKIIYHVFILMIFTLFFKVFY